jgi:hypothetical protein
MTPQHRGRQCVASASAWLSWLYVSPFFWEASTWCASVLRCRPLVLMRSPDISLHGAPHNRARLARTDVVCLDLLCVYTGFCRGTAYGRPGFGNLRSAQCFDDGYLVLRRRLTRLCHLKNNRDSDYRTWLAVNLS